MAEAAEVEPPEDTPLSLRRPSAAETAAAETDAAEDEVAEMAANSVLENEPTAEQPIVGAVAQSEALRVGAATDVGLRRDSNEDAFVATHPVFAVADGMGGHLAGEVASEMAVQVLIDRFPDGETVAVGAVVDAVRDANLAIFHESRTDASRHGMGTTLTALVRLDDTHLGLVNVGDSRAYVSRNGELHQLSIDHSYVQELIERGELHPGDARTHPNRNIVTRALGVEPRLDIDAWVLPMVAADRYLLCSDGLVDDVLDDAIGAVLDQYAEPQEAAEALVRLALQSGGRDNVTAVIVDVMIGFDPDGEIPSTAALLKPSPRATTSATQPAPTPSDITAPLIRPGSDDADPDIGSADGIDLAALPRRTVSIATVIFLALIAGVFVAAFAITAAYARSGYFVDFKDDTVVVYRGRPGGVLWFDPTVAVVTQVDRDELTPAEIDSVERHPTFDTSDRATRFAQELDDGDPAQAPTSVPSATIAPPSSNASGDGNSTGTVPRTSP